MKWTVSFTLVCNVDVEAPNAHYARRAAKWSLELLEVSEEALAGWQSMQCSPCEVARIGWEIEGEPDIEARDGSDI